MKDLYVISGVTGMTGSQLAASVVLKGNTVIGFDNFFASDLKSVENIKNNPLFKFFNFDLNDVLQMQKIKARVKEVKNGFNKTHFINCAAVVHTEYFYNPEATFKTNVAGMKGFLDMAIECGADTFINCSTSEIYSMQSYIEGGVKEDDYIVMATCQHSQRTSYAAGKLMTEYFMAQAVIDGKIKGCSIRFANVYANSELYPKHIIPHIITSLKRGCSVTLLENAKTTKRTFLHNIDSCNGVLELINNPNSLDGGVYNIATTEEISITDLVALIAKKMKKDDYKIVFEGFRQSDPPRRVLNIDKILNRTKWKPTVDLSRGIDMCLKEPL